MRADGRRRPTCRGRADGRFAASSERFAQPGRNRGAARLLGRWAHALTSTRSYRRALTPDDLARFEDEMKKVAEEKFPFVRAEVSRGEA